MATVTVKEALEVALPPRSTVVGGARGLDKAITWARILRQRIPALEPLEGGELVLASVASLGLLGKEITIPSVLDRLRLAGVSALAVQGFLSEEAGAAADTLGVPLIQLPDSAALHQVERAIIRLIMDREADEERLSTTLRARLEADFLGDLFGGKIGSEELAVSKSRRLGHEPNPPYLVFILGLSGPVDGSDRAPLSITLEEFGRLAREAIRPWNTKALLRRLENSVEVVLPVPEHSTLAETRKLVEGVRWELESRIAVDRVLAGMSRPSATLLDIADSYSDAKQALELGPKMPDSMATISFEDLGVRGLLFRLRRSSELKRFYCDALAKLKDYDTGNDGELLNTLARFFACNGNHSRAAADLHLHRNSLAYRLERIQEITGFDLDNSEVRLRLQVALVIGEILSL